MISEESKIFKCVAIIPARGGSKRLKRKNVVDFYGVPIIERVISNAKKSNLFTDVIVSTDDKEIADLSAKSKARVFMRGVILSDDKATVVNVCADVLSRVKKELGYNPDMFCCIYATAVLLTKEDLIESYSLMSRKPAADVVMGVSKYEIHPLRAMEVRGDSFLTPKQSKGVSGKSQDFPDYCASNGTLYWARSKSFFNNLTFYPKKLKEFMKLTVVVGLPTCISVMKTMVG